MSAADFGLAYRQIEARSDTTPLALFHVSAAQGANAGMYPQLNHRLLFLLLGLLAGATGVGYVVHEAQVARVTRELLESADQAEAEGRYDQAAVDLHRYLSFRPDDTPVLVRYAMALDRTAVTLTDQWRVVGAFEQILARRPAQPEIRRRLAVRACQLGWYSEARQHVEFLLQDAPGQGDLEFLLGQCQEQEKSYVQAAASYRSAIQHDPRLRDSYLHLAALLENQLHQPRKAEEAYDKLIKVLPEDSEGWYARAVFRMAHNTVEEAAGDLTHALKLAPNDPRIVRLAAQIAQHQLRLQDARICWQRGCRLQPQDPSWYLGLATLELRAGRSSQAIVCLCDGLRALPRQADLLALLAQTLLERRDHKQVEEIVALLRTPQAPPRLADLLQGWLLLQRQQDAAGVALLEQVAQAADAPAEVAAQAWLLLAGYQEQRGATDRWLAALRSAAQRAPAWPTARLALGSGLRAQGLVDEAIEQYRQLVQQTGPPEEAWVLLGQVLLEREQGSGPRKASLAEVERLLRKADRYPSQQVPAALLHAELLLLQQQPVEARKLLETMRSRFPREIAFAVALAELERRTGAPGRAAHLLAQELHKGPERLSLRLAELAVCPLLPPAQALRMLAEMEKAVSSFSAAEQAELLAQMAQVYYLLDQSREGQRICQRLAQQQPESLRAQVALLELAWEGGEKELLAQLVPAIRRLEGEEGAYWRVAAAARIILLAQEGATANLEEARSLLAEARRRRPEWAMAALLSGQRAELGADPKAAAAAYLEAFAHGARSPRFMLRLVTLLNEQGRGSQAEPILRKLEQVMVLPPALAQVAAEMALRNHSFDRALELAREVVATQGHDYRYQIWYGHILESVGRHRDAEEAFREACSLREDRSETWLALLAHLARRGQETEAGRCLERMKSHVSDEEMPLCLALASEAMGQLTQARQWFEAALSQAPDSGLVLQRAATFYLRLGQDTEAEALLRRMLDPGLKLPGSNRAWARRQLALQLAFRGGPGSHDNAHQLLEEGRQSSPDLFADQRARLFLQATEPDQRAEAIHQLEDLRKDGVLTPGELYRLVQLHEAAGNMEEARTEMIDLLALDTSNPEYLAHHIERLLQRNKKEEARPWIRRLENLEPNSVRLRTFRSQLTESAPGHSSSPPRRNSFFLP